MTSAQIMQTGQCPALRGLLALFVILTAAGCTSRRPVREVLVAPYATQQLWAVVPPRNESGISTVQTDRIADMIAHEIQAVEGLDVLPVNRVLLGMRRLGFEAIDTAGDAQALLTLLDVNGLVLGSVTAYDPYPPLTMGLALQLYVRSSDHGDDDIDPATISRTTSGQVPPASQATIYPVAHAAGVFRADDQDTRLHLNTYAATRHAEETAFGPDIFLVRIDLFAQFVSHRLMHELLAREHLRVTPMVAQEAEQ